MDLTKQFSLELLQSSDWKTERMENILHATKSKSAFKKEMERSGVYVFWWTGSLDTLEKLHKHIEIQGKVNVDQKEEGDRHHRHRISFHKEWLTQVKIGEMQETAVALYVGKSTNVLRRFGLHMKTKTEHENWRNSILNGKPYDSISHYKLHSPTTSCQFRSGMSLLCLGTETNEEFLEIINKNIHFSYLPLDNPNNRDEYVAHRFYLEDYLIGALRPWFNLDSER